MNFYELNLAPFILEALEEINFKQMTKVQAEVIPAALSGKNLTVQSQTGSGKTHAFLIPILQMINPDQNEVQVVVTAPSRELATQLYDVAVQIASHHPKHIRIENYIGGTDKQRQINRLTSSGQPHIVIGTPGRIFDLMSEHVLFVQTAEILVVDEADMTMDLGFLSLVDDIASRMHDHLQVMVFSATIPQSLEVFLNKYVTKPQVITIEPEHIISPEITNYLISTRGQSREELTYNLLTMGYTYLAIVFTNTRQYADEMSTYLKNRGLKVATIHGDISSRERNRIMRQIRNLDFQYVVATDLAARGIDIPGVSMVINTELPNDLEFFIHRVGRTGRNEVKGTAITYITPDDDQAISRLENMGISFEMVEYQKGELIKTKSRHARRDRSDTAKLEEDHVIRGMIERQRRRPVRPGYKRKLNEEIKNYRRKKTRKNKRKYY